jgi:site-specific DNA-methyltransferase (cytosine-N4-specific)
MKQVILEWQNYKLFPYEKDFANIEIEHMFGLKPKNGSDKIRLPLKSFVSEDARRLTYFSKIVYPDGTIDIPYQAMLESSAKKGKTVKQVTRYSAHGLHEYKGKFNPQIVRSIGNILGLRPGASILDPFCGSGTTLLESAHIGWNSVGVDINPHAVRIANAKIRALQIADGPLNSYAKNIICSLQDKIEVFSGTHDINEDVLNNELGMEWINRLPSQDYLQSWFTTPVLSQILIIKEAITEHIAETKDRDIFLVALSDLLRDVSLQEPADLRIRRRKNTLANYPLLKIYSKKLPERIDLVCKARKQLGVLANSNLAILGDIRSINSNSFSNFPVDKFDAVITSPPYETALPYIDTQRLSLVLLGDIDSKEINSTEKELIGAREITKIERLAIEEVIRKGDQNLPQTVLKLCRDLLDAASLPGNGFRRVNRPALTYRYFKKMYEFFLNIKNVLHQDAKVALVVGTNQTKLGGIPFHIDTPRLLTDIAVQCGYSFVEEYQMNTYQRYDLHQQNSINNEMLIIFSAL